MNRTEPEFGHVCVLRPFVLKKPGFLSVRCWHHRAGWHCSVLTFAAVCPEITSWVCRLCCEAASCLVVVLFPWRGAWFLTVWEMSSVCKWRTLVADFSPFWLSYLVFNQTFFFFFFDNLKNQKLIVVKASTLPSVTRQSGCQFYIFVFWIWWFCKNW